MLIFLNLFYPKYSLSVQKARDNFFALWQHQRDNANSRQPVRENPYLIHTVSFSQETRFCKLFAKSHDICISIHTAVSQQQLTKLYRPVLHRCTKEKPKILKTSSQIGLLFFFCCWRHVCIQARFVCVFDEITEKLYIHKCIKV